MQLNDNIVNGKMNKTSISSVVCFDIIDFSKKSEIEKKTLQQQFKALINHAVVDTPPEDRVVIETDNGAVIACSGPLEKALEDALFIALTVRDDALNSNTDNEHALYLLIGISLGSVKVTKDNNERLNVAGDGLVEAQRIMSFANPNQILVSRAYYDMASKLTLEIAEMFEKYDMHAYEHDIYAVRLLNEKAAGDYSATVVGNLETGEGSFAAIMSGWKPFILPALLAFVMLFFLMKWLSSEENTTEVIELPEMAVPYSEGAPTLGEESVNEGLAEGEVSQEDAEQANTVKEVAIKKKAIKKKAKKKTANTEQAKPSTNQSTEQEPNESVVQPIPDEVSQDEEKSGWEAIKESLKQGAESNCSQVEIAMNQCKP